MNAAPIARTPVYIGTYTRVLPYDTGRGTYGEGIYLYHLDMSSGALEFASVTTGIDNPSFVILDPEQRRLYATSEMTGPGGIEAPGYVSAFSIDPATFQLTFLDRKPSGGVWPAHMTTDEAGRFLLLVHYGDASTCVFPILQDGSLGEPTDRVRPPGLGADQDPRQVSHPHSVTLDAARRLAFVADKGMDRVLAYRLDTSSGKLTAAEEPWVSVKPGAGPRHFDFHPGGKYAYVINELDSTIGAFAYDASKGTLREVQTVPTLPAGFSGANTGADIHVHPSGKFLYGSNRGHDSIAIYTIDESTGRLAHVGNEPTGGETPRNFGLDSTGAFLLAANQDSDTLVTFRIDQRSGRLAPTGHVAEVPSPACVRFLAAR